MVPGSVVVEWIRQVLDEQREQGRGGRRKYVKKKIFCILFLWARKMLKNNKKYVTMKQRKRVASEQEASCHRTTDSIAHAYAPCPSLSRRATAALLLDIYKHTELRVKAGSVKSAPDITGTGFLPAFLPHPNPGLYSQRKTCNKTLLNFI